jgi:peptidylprolyl isomerase
MRSRHLLAGSVLAAALIAGCGSSTSNSDLAGIRPIPSASQTLTYTATSTSTSTTATATGPTIVTPKSGPLSKKPTITLPKTAAPASLKTVDLIAGTGAAVATGDTITVNYTGELYKNGSVFDSSWNAGRTQFSTLIGAGAVIKGWDQGLIGMRVGGRRELIIPPALAYAAAGQGAVPPNATLIFVIDLLSVSAPAGATGATGATIASGATG